MRHVTFNRSKEVTIRRYDMSTHVSVYPYMYRYNKYACKCTYTCVPTLLAALRARFLSPFIVPAHNNNVDSGRERVNNMIIYCTE